MKDLQDIITLARQDGGARAALATLIRVDGSSYRRPGASMLVTPGGARAGAISGGCLERDVERHAREALDARRPRVVLYDTQSEADLILGTGLGCGGRLEILVEPIDLTAERSPMARWSTAIERREALAEVIIVARPGEPAPAAAGTPLPIGWRLFLWSHADQAQAVEHHDSTATATVLAPASATATPSSATSSSARVSSSAGATTAIRDLIDQATAAAREALAVGRSSAVTLATAAGPVETFVRVVVPPVQLLVCGAGDDAMPLVKMARTLGWYIRVIDHRAAFATRDRFPDVAHVDVAAAGELPPSVRLDARTVAIVMNHNYAADSGWLRGLAPLGLPYLGLLGARARSERLLREAELDRLAPSALSDIHAPAGLDIGAEGAEQIALSIISEMQAVLASRPGASLRDRALPAASPAAAAPSTQRAPRVSPASPAAPEAPSIAAGIGVDTP